MPRETVFYRRSMALLDADRDRRERVSGVYVRDVARQEPELRANPGFLVFVFLAAYGLVVGLGSLLLR